VGLRAGLDGAVNLASADRSESQYRLSCPDLNHLKTTCSVSASAYGGWLFQPCAHNVSDLFGAFRILIPVPVSC